MRLRKGFGTVRKLTGNRRNQYAVHPPKVNGVRPKAICYVNDYHTGVCILNAWHNGKYYSGMEMDLKERELDEIVGTGSSTFQAVYDLYWEHRFGESAAKELEKSSQAATRSAWLKLEDFWSRNMDEVTIMELQSVVNETAREYSKTTVTRLIGLIKRMYRFAVPRELCRKDVGMYVETPRVKEEEHHDSFTDEEIDKLWRTKDGLEENEAEKESSVDVAATVRMILTMIYSGFRIGAWSPHGEYDGMSVDLENLTFTGGVKTDAGKNRVVPIHTSILPLVEQMDGIFLCGKGESQFRRDMKVALEKIGVRPLTPHSCRHTFHWLLERAGVNEADRKRLMGHSLKGDVTNGVYGHRGIEELRREIEKIDVCSETRVAA